MRRRGRCLAAVGCRDGGRLGVGGVVDVGVAWCCGLGCWDWDVGVLGWDGSFGHCLAGLELRQKLTPGARPLSTVLQSQLRRQQGVHGSPKRAPAAPTAARDLDSSGQWASSPPFGGAGQPPPGPERAGSLGHAFHHQGARAVCGLASHWIPLRPSAVKHSKPPKTPDTRRQDSKLRCCAEASSHRHLHCLVHPTWTRPSHSRPQHPSARPPRRW